MQHEVSFKALVNRVLSVTIARHQACELELLKNKTRMVKLIKLTEGAPDDMGEGGAGLELSRETLNQWLTEALESHKQSAH